MTIKALFVGGPAHGSARYVDPDIKYCDSYYAETIEEMPIPQPTGKITPWDRPPTRRTRYLPVGRWIDNMLIMATDDIPDLDAALHEIAADFLELGRIRAQIKREPWLAKHLEIGAEG